MDRLRVDRDRIERDLDVLVVEEVAAEIDRPDEEPQEVVRAEETGGLGGQRDLDTVARELRVASSDDAQERAPVVDGRVEDVDVAKGAIAREVVGSDSHASSLRERRHATSAAPEIA